MPRKADAPAAARSAVVTHRPTARPRRASRARWPQRGRRAGSSPQRVGKRVVRIGSRTPLVASGFPFGPSSVQPRRPRLALVVRGSRGDHSGMPLVVNVSHAVPRLADRPRPARLPGRGLGRRLPVLPRRLARDRAALDGRDPGRDRRPRARARSSAARRLAAARRQPAAFLIVGATFSAIPFSLLAFATLSLPGVAGLAADGDDAALHRDRLGAVWLRQRLSPQRHRGARARVRGGGVPARRDRRSTIGPATVVAVAAGLGRRSATRSPARSSGGGWATSRRSTSRRASSSPRPSSCCRSRCSAGSRRCPRRPRPGRSSRWASSRPRSPGRSTSGSCPGRRRRPPAARRSSCRCSASSGAG